MRILLCADVSASRVIGGAERVIYEQARRLTLEGHRVHIFTRKYEHHTRLRERIDKIEEWRYEVNRNDSARFLLSTMVNGRRRFRDLLREYGFDCVNAYQPFSAYAILKEIKNQKLPLTYTCFSLSFEEYISRNHIKLNDVSSLSRFNIWLRRFIEKKVMQASEEIIVLSDYTRRSILSTYRLNDKPIRIIPAGVNLDRFRPGPDKAVIREDLGLPLDRFVLFTVRNLVPRMGLGNLIEAVALAKKEIPDLLLVIGGDGPMAESLKTSAIQAGVEKNIRFEGFIPDKALPAFYQASDIFVLPTKELEGFGLITLEALASGLPVLGTPVGGTLEILGRFDKHFLFRDTSPEAMAESIVKFYEVNSNGSSSYSALSRKCRAFAENNYNWQLNIDTLGKVLQNRKNARCA